MQNNLIAEVSRRRKGNLKEVWISVIVSETKQSIYLWIEHFNSNCVNPTDCFKASWALSSNITVGFIIENEVCSKNLMIKSVLTTFPYLVKINLFLRDTEMLSILILSLNF